MSKARDLAGIFNLNPTSGTTAQRPVTANVGEIYYNGTTGKTQIYTPTGWQDMASGIPFGNTAGRPAAVTGQPYFNGEAARLEMYTESSGWQNVVQEVPGVASITGNYSEQTNSGIITIMGTNFVTGAIASAIGTNGVETQATSTTYNSLVQVTAVFNGLSNANEPYDIKVTNPSNLFGLIPDALYVNASPVWQTASGSLGTFNELVSITLSALSSTDSDSQTITYDLASGSTLPSGVTLNSSTGVISGILPDIATDTTYSFTVNATDGLNVVPRSFNITSNADISLEYMVIAGGGSGASSIGGGGGAGGMREGSFALARGVLQNIVIGAGGASPGFTSTYELDGLKGENSRFASIYSTGGGGGGAHTTSSPGSGGYTYLQGGSGGGGGRHTPGGGGGAGGPGVSGTGTDSTIFQYGGNGNEGGYSPVEGYPGGNGLEGGGSYSYTDGNGGPGRQSSITGVATYYAGGGGGGGHGPTDKAGGIGGLGGGGKGRVAASGDNATGHGSGGGGAGYPGNVAGGAGSGGLVVLAYPSTRPSLTVSGGLTYTLDTITRPGYNVYKFTAGSGTVTF
jgi:hypothetical protein